MRNDTARIYIGIVLVVIALCLWAGAVEVVSSLVKG